MERHNMGRPLLLFSLLVLLFAGCGKPDQAREIRETRTLATPSEDNTPFHGTSLSREMPPHHPPISPYTWSLPEGWTEIGLTAMRAGNFRVDANPDIDCYLTVIQGTGGGLSANVNRWRQQMGQEDLDDAAIEALPGIDVLGQRAVLVDIEGNFTGMTGSEKPGYRMLGLLCPMQEETVFVKMTGPSQAVLAEKEKFISFCASLKEGGVASGESNQEDK